MWNRFRRPPPTSAKADAGASGRASAIAFTTRPTSAVAPRITDPELLRSSLANVILRMLSLQLGDVDQFPFLEAPDPRVVADGYRRLAEISAIDEARQLTPIGRTVARLPIDVQLARMLVEARKAA